MAEVYRDALARKSTNIAEVKRSINCLIEGVPVEKVPIKLYCTYKTVLESIDQITPETLNNSVSTSPDLTEVSFQPKEGDEVEAPVDLPNLGSDVETVTEVIEEVFEDLTPEEEPSLVITEEIKDMIRTSPIPSENDFN